MTKTGSKTKVTVAFEPRRNYTLGEIADAVMGLTVERINARPAVCRGTEGAHVPAMPSQQQTWCLNCGLGIDCVNASSEWRHVVREATP